MNQKKRKVQTLGIFLLILGLLLYQFGTLATLHQAALMDYVLSVLPDIQLVELIGVLLQLLGIALIVVGFTSLVSNIIATQLEDERAHTENEMRRLRYEISVRIEESVGNIVAHLKPNVKTQNPQTTQVCKFCGAQINEQDTFCSVCNRSQK